MTGSRTTTTRATRCSCVTLFLACHQVANSFVLRPPMNAATLPHNSARQQHQQRQNQQQRHRQQQQNQQLAAVFTTGYYLENLTPAPQEVFSSTVAYSGGAEAYLNSLTQLGEQLMAAEAAVTNNINIINNNNAAADSTAATSAAAAAAASADWETSFHLVSEAVATPIASVEPHLSSPLMQQQLSPPSPSSPLPQQQQMLSTTCTPITADDFATSISLQQPQMQQQQAPLQQAASSLTTPPQEVADAFATASAATSATSATATNTYVPETWVADNPIMTTSQFADASNTAFPGGVQDIPSVANNVAITTEETLPFANTMPTTSVADATSVTAANQIPFGDVEEHIIASTSAPNDIPFTGVQDIPSVANVAAANVPSVNTMPTTSIADAAATAANNIPLGDVENIPTIPTTSVADAASVTVSSSSSTTTTAATNNPPPAAVMENVVVPEATTKMDAVGGVTVNSVAEAAQNAAAASATSATTTTTTNPETAAASSSFDLLNEFAGSSSYDNLMVEGQQQQTFETSSNVDEKMNELTMQAQATLSSLSEKLATAKDQLTNMVGGRRTDSDGGAGAAPFEMPHMENPLKNMEMPHMENPIKEGVAAASGGGNMDVNQVLEKSAERMQGVGQALLDKGTSTVKEAGQHLFGGGGGGGGSTGIPDAAANLPGVQAVTKMPNVFDKGHNAIQGATTAVKGVGEAPLSELGANTIHGIQSLASLILEVLDELALRVSAGETSLTSLIGSAQTRVDEVISGAVHAVTSTIQSIGEISIADVAKTLVAVLIAVSKVLLLLFNVIVRTLSGHTATEWVTQANHYITHQADQLTAAAAKFAVELSEKSLSELAAMMGSFIELVANFIVEGFQGLMQMAEVGTLQLTQNGAAAVLPITGTDTFDSVSAALSAFTTTASL